MKKRTTIRISAFLLCLCCAFFTSCKEDDGKGYVFGYDISSNPGSLDPQYASDRESYLIIGCVFEGLFRAGADGNAEKAMTESYTVSDDGLTYTFKLKQDRYWTDVNGFDKQVTADDFVFGFQRLFMPETRAPKASEYFCIKNAQKINNDDITDVSQLGVKADGKFGLTIELEYTEPSFEMLLTMPAAMPCNKEYFTAAQGKYGLDAERTPSNGPFYVKTWYYDAWSKNNNNMVLRYSDKYDKHDEVTPLGLNFFVEDNHMTDFTDGTSQSIVLSGSIAKDYLGNDYIYDEYSTAVYGIMMNTEKSIFKSDKLRYALLFASDKSSLSLPFGYSAADGIVAPSVKNSFGSYRDTAGSRTTVKPDEVKAYSSYQSACENIDKADLHSVNILAVQNRDEEIGESLSGILQQWQAKLGFYCSISYVSESEYEEKISGGDYTLALTRINGEYNRPEAYLGMFTSGGYKYSAMDDAYSALIQQAAAAKDSKEEYELCVKAEKQLITDGRFIPVAYVTEYFISTKNCEGVVYDPFTGQINYRNALYFD